MKSFVATSTAATAAEAGKEVAAKVAAGIEGAKLAMAYGSCDYDSAELLKAVAAELPGVPVVGNTSFTGIVTPEGFVGGDTPFVGILALGGDDLAVGTAGAARETENCPRVIGRKLAEQAMAAAGKDCPPDYWYMVASPAEEEYYIKGVTDVIGRVPFFGGSAADNEIAGKWWMYNGTETFQDGCVVAFFYTDTPFVNKFTGAYAETEDFGVVTKMIGDRAIAEIDGKPALQVYADWRGMGKIPASGLKMRDEFAAFDIERVEPIEIERVEKKTACRCGEVLRGVINPTECPLFGKACQPLHAIGPCMVSVEGVCAAWFKYGGRKLIWNEE